MKIDHTREFLCFAVGEYVDKMASKIVGMIMDGHQRDAESMALAFSDMVSAAAKSLDRAEKQEAKQAPKIKPVSVLLPVTDPMTPEPDMIPETDTESAPTAPRAPLQPDPGPADEDDPDEISDEDADVLLAQASAFGVDPSLLVDNPIFPDDGKEEIPPDTEFAVTHSDPAFSSMGQFAVPITSVQKAYAVADNAAATKPHPKLPRATGIVRTVEPGSEVPPQPQPPPRPRPILPNQRPPTPVAPQAPQAPPRRS